MSELHTMTRPGHLLPPDAENPIAVKGTVLTVKETSISTVETVLADSRTLLETVLAHPKAQKELNDQERIFVEAYLSTGNARQSALTAGYAEGTASSKACKWVRCDPVKNPKLHVFRALHMNSKKIHEKTVQQVANKLTSEVIDSQWVLNESVAHVQRSKGVIPTHTTRRIDPLTNAEVLVEHYDYDGNQVAKGIEMVAKNKKVKAFSNELEVNTSSSLAQLLINIAPNIGLPVIEHDIQDADIIEPAQLTRPPVLPNV